MHAMHVNIAAIDIRDWPETPYLYKERWNHDFNNNIPRITRRPISGHAFKEGAFVPDVKRTNMKFMVDAIQRMQPGIASRYAELVLIPTSKKSRGAETDGVMKSKGDIVHNDATALSHGLD